MFKHCFPTHQKYSKEDLNLKKCFGKGGNGLKWSNIIDPVLNKRSNLKIKYTKLLWMNVSDHILNIIIFILPNNHHLILICLLIFFRRLVIFSFIFPLLMLFPSTSYQFYEYPGEQGASNLLCSNASTLKPQFYS